MRKRRSMRHQRKKKRTDFLSTRLLTVLISILTSALMLCGIAIYAEVQSGGSDPQEQAEELTPNMEAAVPISVAPEPQPQAEPEVSVSTETEKQPETQEEPKASEPAGEGEQPEGEQEEQAVVPNNVVTTEEPTEEATPKPTEESTPEPGGEPTQEATQEPSPTAVPTVQPTENPTSTTDPTTDPTTEPTYAPSAYTISITPPSGWYRDTANVTLRVADLNGTGWQSIQMRINGDGAWVDITQRFASSEYADIEISEDCTIYVAVISPSGNAHTANKYIACFDREIPVVRAAIDGETLRAEGKDNLSGVAAIIVCGHRFTDLDHNVLRIRLEDYADNYEQISIQAEDNVGNLSKIKTLKNPYYDPNLPTPSPQPTCVPTATPTAKPTATPKPTSPGGGGSSSTATPKPTNSGGGGSSSTATPKPSAVATVTPTPSASVEPTISPVATGTTGTTCLCNECLCVSASACQCETVCTCGYAQTQALAQAAALTLESGTGFSSTGNAVARDLLYDKHSNKQFIHMQTRDGASFYVVIDYDKPLDEDGESYETFFLNAVDARDLFDLVDEEDLPAQYQATPTPMPTDVPIPTPEPTEAPPEATPEPAPEPQQSSGMGGMMGILLLALVGGGALWFFKFKKPKGQSGQRNNFDDFDYEDDDEEYEDEDAEGYDE